MATTVTLVLDAPDAVVFPDRCVGCGGAATTTSRLAFAKVVTNARRHSAPGAREAAGAAL